VHHTIFLLECDLRNHKKISSLFFMFLFMMAYVELDMDKGDFFFLFSFLVHSSFCRLLSHHLIFLFATTYFACFCLCFQSDKLRGNYSHIVGHLLQAMFHIALDFLLIALDDLLILTLLSFFFMLWILSSNC
jgi:hypothetical protein